MNPDDGEIILFFKANQNAQLTSNTHTINNSNNLYLNISHNMNCYVNALLEKCTKSYNKCIYHTHINKYQSKKYIITEQ